MSLPKEITRETVAECMAKGMDEFAIGYVYPDVSLVTICDVMGVVKGDEERAKKGLPPIPPKHEKEPGHKQHKAHS